MSQAATQLKVRVAAAVEVTPLIKRFHLEPLGGAKLPPFSGGAHIVVDLPNDGRVQHNPYSLTNPLSAATGYTISVRRDAAGRGGSCFMHDHVRPGTTLHISHPANLFPLALHGRRHLLVAGGIGITPILGMAEQLHHARLDFALYYTSRSRAQAAYADELVARYGPRVHLFYTEQGERIPLHRLLDRQPLGTHLYVCGPDRMIDWAVGVALALGWPEQSIHQERFTAPAIGQPYTVRLARAAVDLTVGSHQSMLDAIEAIGIAPPYLCRGGACGQCETAVLDADGVLLHADHFLTDTEKASGKKVMLCVSRFAGARLVLDL